MTLPIFPPVHEQAGKGMTDNAPQGEFRQGGDARPKPPGRIRVARPERVAQDGPKKIAVLVELDLVRSAALAGIDGVALVRDEAAGQALDHRAGQIPIPERGQGFGDDRLVANPFPVVLPNAAVQPTGPGDHGRELGSRGLKKAVKERIPGGNRSQGLVISRGALRAERANGPSDGD
jgi:hypothetical protein